jgi:hypothetical protein
LSVVVVDDGVPDAVSLAEGLPGAIVAIDVEAAVAVAVVATAVPDAVAVLVAT